MVFFACLLVTVILYYLQSDGLIYVTIVAVIAELFNLFMTQTVTATAKNKVSKKYGKIITDYKNKVSGQIKTINQLKKIRDDSVHRLYKANQAIKQYEEQLGIEQSQAIEIPSKVQQIAASEPDPLPTDSQEETDKASVKSKKEDFVDLPSGSNRKELPI